MRSSGKTRPRTGAEILYKFYLISEAAALWCGVPEDQVKAVIQEARPLAKLGYEINVWTHQDYPDLKHKSRAIVMALKGNKLDYRTLDNPPSHSRLEFREILGRSLRDWMEEEFPGDRPAFLFGEAQSDTDATISTEQFHALQTECVALKAKLAERALPDERSKRTYQHIIAVLLRFIAGEIQDIKPHPSFVNQTRLIDTIVEKFPGCEGLSQRTLQQKFPEAKRALQSD